MPLASLTAAQDAIVIDSDSDESEQHCISAVDLPAFIAA